MTTPERSTADGAEHRPDDAGPGARNGPGAQAARAEHAVGAFPGDRVVVRYRLGPGAPADWRPQGAANAGSGGAPQRSDITGTLIADDDPLVIDRAGSELRVPLDAVDSIRLLSATVVRNSDIRALEHAAALAWPGTESAWIDGWLVRAGGGFTRRANSAVPLDRSARAHPGTLAAIASWYDRHHLPVLLALPDRLLPPHQVGGTPASGAIQVLVRDLPAEHPTECLTHAVEVGRIGLDAHPSEEWLRALDPADPHLAGRVVGATDAPAAYAGVRAEADGSVAATGRGVVTRAPDGTRWLGISAVWTDTRFRRRGHGDAVLDSLLTWGAEQGAQRAYLQVDAANRIAGSWYRARGFGLHHTYRYLTPQVRTPWGGR